MSTVDHRTLTDLLTRLAAVHPEPASSVPQVDDEAVSDWFDTSTDPEIAQAVAQKVPGARPAVEIGLETSGSGRVITAGSVFPVGLLTEPFTAAARRCDAIVEGELSWIAGR
ncbi:hypothetical protein [Actinokineospora terrae]|uniref:Uncharacterized protein n=1 Tax=Actinokineospora terrae TaxID=155974 RepID=A0A1H9X970_9PSEU|nr:hypothetical protein [Actinokineospora terrae]SES42619.1 hypothetical protein SAMN04487818_113163 [Actinokineospora terrae]